MIPTYNLSEYVGATLESVLAQDPGPEWMQIEVVDDASSHDNPESVVREIGRGRVGFHRNPYNLGQVGNFNGCIRRAQGEFVHILHGDDCVLPGFYERARRAVMAHPEIGAWICRVNYIDESGRWIGQSELEADRPGILGADFRDRAFVDQRIQFVGIMVKKLVYQQLGGFRSELKLCLDWDMWRRIVLAHPVYYDPEPLACYRSHPRSAYARALKSGEQLSEERRSIRMALDYLAPTDVNRLRRAAFRMTAIRAIRMARREAGLGDRGSSIRLLRDALRCSMAPGVVARVLKTLPQVLWQTLAFALLYGEAALALS
jgi:glycosyltransferase involved in cell wall biosynthesis